MFVGFLLAFLITDNAWKKFQTNPTFTSLRLNTNQAQISYPTVSVCPVPAGDMRKISELIVKAGVKKREIQEISELLETIPNFSYGAKGLRSVLLTEQGADEAKKLNFDNLRAHAFHLALSCADVFHSCSFKNKSVECCNDFLPVFSENGFCYSFNARFYGTPQDEYDRMQVKTIISRHFQGLQQKILLRG